MGGSRKGVLNFFLSACRIPLPPCFLFTDSRIHLCKKDFIFCHHYLSLHRKKFLLFLCLTLQLLLLPYPVRYLPWQTRKVFLSPSRILSPDFPCLRKTGFSYLAVRFFAKCSVFSFLLLFCQRCNKLCMNVCAQNTFKPVKFMIFDLFSLSFAGCR